MTNNFIIEIVYLPLYSIRNKFLTDIVHIFSPLIKTLLFCKCFCQKYVDKSITKKNNDKQFYHWISIPPIRNKYWTNIAHIFFPHNKIILCCKRVSITQHPDEMFAILSPFSLLTPVIINFISGNEERGSVSSCYARSLGVLFYGEASRRLDVDVTIVMSFPANKRQVRCYGIYIYRLGLRAVSLMESITELSR